SSLFYRQHTNMIDWVRDASTISPNPNPWTPVNIASVSFSGIETSVQLSLKKRTTWGLNKFNVNYTYITAQHNFTSEQESRYAITSMRQQLNAVGQFDLSEKIQLNVTYRLVQRIEQPLYQVVDAKILVPIKSKWTVFAEGNNLTNTQYVEAGFVQMPGRWFKLGLTFGHKAIENPRP
ncbi:MAG: TonB-dependent receptor, partial [Cryomorphaceae bacterium]|nr:TonB-dependent receptor [Cryomorphaceae bacterium]